MRLGAPARWAPIDEADRRASQSRLGPGGSDQDDVSGLTATSSRVSDSVSHASCMIELRAASRMIRSTCGTSPSTPYRSPVTTVISVVAVVGCDRSWLGVIASGGT